MVRAPLVGSAMLTLAGAVPTLAGVVLTLAGVVLTLACAEGGDDVSQAGNGGAIAWTTAAAGGSGGTGAVGVGGGASGGAGAAPVVVSIEPADRATALPADTTVSVTFSEAMDEATATGTTSGTCMGSLQLSLDGFATCIALSGPPSSTDGTTFTLTPASPLDSRGLVRVRASTELTNATGSPLVANFDSAGFTVRYANTLTIDGSNDFAVADEVPSSTPGATLLVSFDDANLYLGLAHPDVVPGGSGNKFVYFLLSTDPTLATGNATSSDDKAKFGVGGQKMMHHYKHQIDGGDYSEFRTANGTDWDTDWGTTGKAVSKASGYIEARIALSELGANTTDLIVTTYTIDYNGQGGDGHLYNMLPAATEGTGLSPRDLSQYVHLQLPTSVPASDVASLRSF